MPRVHPLIDAFAASVNEHFEQNQDLDHFDKVSFYEELMYYANDGRNKALGNKVDEVEAREAAEDSTEAPAEEPKEKSKPKPENPAITEALKRIEETEKELKKREAERTERRKAKERKEKEREEKEKEESTPE